LAKKGHRRVDVVKLFVYPQGRIPRAVFWMGSLLLLAIELAARFALGIPLAPLPSDPFLVRLLSFLIELVLLYPGVVVMVKRLHDRNLSGQLIGWLVVPYCVLLITNLLGMSGDPDRMGVVESVLLLATGVIAVAFIVDLGFRRGTRGDNRYGPDPLGKEIA
jgi:uncharacterized membrane protein YhaH (DUF805 family)